MNSSPSVAANLSNDARKGLAILSLSKTEPIAHLADREGVSRQFLYRQKQKAAGALDEAFAAKGDSVLFYLPVTEAWLNQLTLALILVCRSSYRGVKELLRDLFNIPIRTAMRRCIWFGPSVCCNENLHHQTPTGSAGTYCTRSLPGNSSLSPTPWPRR